MINMKIKNRESGFTLIEAVVSTAVFAFVVSSLIGVYISVLRLDTRTRAHRAVVNDARYIMDFLAKEIRDGRIDYPSYPSQLTCGLSCGNTSYIGTDLYLVNQNDESERIYFYDRTANQAETNTTCAPSTSICGLYITKGSATAMLNSPNIKVTQLKFYTSPWGNPFTLANTYNQQPNVTVVLELVSNYNARDQVKVNLESTFSTLYYPTRQ